jgi:hypothetical protein
MNGFNGILTSKSLWLSDAYYMNDYKEHRWVLDRAIEQLHELKEPKNIALFSEVQKYIDGIQIHPFACCFSSEPDSLSQWRAYAEDGAGFAIGFGGMALRLRCESYTKDHEITCASVVYNARVQHKIRSTIIHDAVANSASAPNALEVCGDMQESWFQRRERNSYCANASRNAGWQKPRGQHRNIRTELSDQLESAHSIFYISVCLSRCGRGSARA